VTSRLQTVHVRVNDAATGQPTPVRIRFTDEAGHYFAPFGRLTEFATSTGVDVGGNLRIGQHKYACIDGACEIRLPPGRMDVRIEKGLEYLPRESRIELVEGKLTLRMEIERLHDLRTRGWFAGDCRAHDLTPHAALLEGAAEGLSVVNLLARRTQVLENGMARLAISNILAFSGQKPALSDFDCQVVVNTFNDHSRLGSLALLNCHRVVYPLSFGGPGENDDWSLTAWCDQCHRKNGLVVWAGADLSRIGECQGEALANLILGKVDAVEFDHATWPGTEWPLEWYGLLDCGIRVPLAGSSGKRSNAIPLGAVRTYARLSPGEEFTYRAWIEAIRAGRTFITNGPVLFVEVDGRGPGNEVPAGPAARLHAEARGHMPLTNLEIVCNGRVIASARAGAAKTEIRLDEDVPISTGGWLAARCVGPGVRAHTSPVYINAADPVSVDTDTVRRFLGDLARTRDWVVTQARCNDKHRQLLIGIVEKAEKILEHKLH
jgi:hypothetical protein